MKKFLLFIVLFFSFSGIFAYDLAKLSFQINAIFDKVESKFKQKYPHNYCKLEKKYYQRVITLSDKLNKKYPKYKNVWLLLKNIAIHRQSAILCQISFSKTKKNSIKQTSVSKQSSSYSNNLERGNFILKKAFDSAYLSSLLQNKQITSQVKLDQGYTLNQINKIQAFYDKFYFKVNNQWFAVKGYSYVSCDDFNNCKNYIISNYSDKFDYLFYTCTGSCKFYMIKKDKLEKIPFSPNVSLNQAIDVLKSKGIKIFNKIYTANFGKNSKVPLAGIVAYNGDYFFMIFKDKEVYYTLLDNSAILLSYVVNHPNDIYVFYKGKIYAFQTKFNFYYLGDKRLYKNVNLQRFAKILYPSFYRISTANYPYYSKDLYKIFILAQQYNLKTLKQWYGWILHNIKYNQKISDLINKAGFNSEQLNQYLAQHPNLAQNWILFYTIKNYEGVCQTISDLFSIVALLDGLDADVVDGITKRGYSHQISEINGFYYDPTFDLTDKTYSHFAMTLQKLITYFKPSGK